jgi:hypothetical protein
MEYIESDLLNYPVIAHQCNCKTTYGAGLYNSIVAKYPYADVYSSGLTREPGNIAVRTVQNSATVICMFAQVFPGKQGKRSDGKEDRLRYFSLCLGKIAKLPIPLDIPIAFPYKIGCGLAGGQWRDYERLLGDFANSSGCKILIVKLSV